MTDEPEPVEWDPKRDDLHPDNVVDGGLVSEADYRALYARLAQFTAYFLDRRSETTE